MEEERQAASQFMPIIEGEEGFVNPFLYHGRIKNVTIVTLYGSGMR